RQPRLSSPPTNWPLNWRSPRPGRRLWSRGVTPGSGGPPGPTLRLKGELMIRVVITTFGTLHGPVPAEGDALLVDLSNALRNPHANPDMRYRTGLDPMVRHHVLTTPGADRVVALNVDRIRALVTVHTLQVQPSLTRVHIACRGGLPCGAHARFPRPRRRSGDGRGNRA